MLGSTRKGGGRDKGLHRPVSDQDLHEGDEDQFYLDQLPEDQVVTYILWINELYSHIGK